MAPFVLVALLDQLQQPLLPTSLLAPSSAPEGASVQSVPLAVGAPFPAADAPAPLVPLAVGARSARSGN